jgi:tRNA(Leu) C34 or U34 (ribose-2'-O)-methylase TrmL
LLLVANSDDKQVCIGLLNPKTPENVGSVMRAAGCYRADAVFYTGQRYARAAKYNTDTKNAYLDIPITGVEDLLQAVPPDSKVVCVELVEGATPLPEFTHPQKAFYILGPEDGSLNQQIVDQADEVVYVPTIGCMNLAATANVLLYDRLAKSGGDFGGNELIRQSRDTNNRVKVR